MCTENWSESLYKRARQEYADYLDGLKQRPFEEMAALAYETAMKQDILEILWANAANTAFLGLREVEKPLETVYREWVDREEFRKSHLWKSMERCSDKILLAEADEHYKNPEAPLYRKNLIEAKKSGEIHLWRGDKKRNEECLAYFDKNIHERYEKRELPAFLQLWVKEFGFERCKALLAAVIMKAAHDGRYFKEVKAHVALVEMPNITYEDFYSNTHPVIINFAYRKLMEMERDREVPKGKDGKKIQKAEPER